MSVQQEKFTEIANAIRSKLGTAEKIKPNDFADKIGQIQAGSGDFMDLYQDYGNRTDYNQGFASPCWNNVTLIPKYDIKPVNAGYLFRYCAFSGDLAKHFEDLGVSVSLANNVGAPAQVFREMPNVTRLFEVDVSKFGSLNYWYEKCPNLETIDLIKLNDTGNTTFSNTFSGCAKLANIRFGGFIGTDISFADCPLLSGESVDNIIAHLKPGVSGKSITFHKDIALDFYQESEITNAGWDIVQ